MKMDMAVTDSSLGAVSAEDGDFLEMEDPKCKKFFGWLSTLADGDRMVALFRWMRSEGELPMSYIAGLFQLDGDDAINLARQLLDGIERRCVEAIDSFAPFVVDEDGRIWWIDFPGSVVGGSPAQA